MRLSFFNRLTARLVIVCLAVDPATAALLASASSPRTVIQNTSGRIRTAFDSQTLITRLTHFPGLQKITSGPTAQEYRYENIVLFAVQGQGLLPWLRSMPSTAGFMIQGVSALLVSLSVTRSLARKMNRRSRTSDLEIWTQRDSRKERLLNILGWGAGGLLGFSLAGLLLDGLLESRSEMVDHLIPALIGSGGVWLTHQFFDQLFPVFEEPRELLQAPVQSLNVAVEESLPVLVEQQLHDMKENLGGEKYEQEGHRGAQKIKRLQPSMELSWDLIKKLPSVYVGLPIPSLGSSIVIHYAYFSGDPADAFYTEGTMEGSHAALDEAFETLRDNPDDNNDGLIILRGDAAEPVQALKMLLQADQDWPRETSAAAYALALETKPGLVEELLLRSDLPKSPSPSSKTTFKTQSPFAIGILVLAQALYGHGPLREMDRSWLAFLYRLAYPALRELFPLIVLFVILSIIAIAHLLDRYEAEISQFRKSIQLSWPGKQTIRWIGGLLILLTLSGTTLSARTTGTPDVGHSQKIASAA